MTNFEALQLVRNHEPYKVSVETLTSLLSQLTAADIVYNIKPEYRDLIPEIREAISVATEKFG